MYATFHSGEIEIQKMTGEVAIADSNAIMIKDTIIKGAIKFIEKQSMVIVSSVDKSNQVWTSILVGEPGFAEVPDPNSLSINLDKVHSDQQDVFYKNIVNGNQIGTLFIELATRRRFRINGTIALEGDKINITILEAYPNCPKYIQQRSIQQPDAHRKVEVKKKFGDSLGKDIQNWISSSDTLFVGSISNEGRLDASHRGGKKGFVEVLDDSTLKVPDYQGNSLFNTIGNVAQNNKSGMLFIDFENKRTLQLTGKAEVLFNQNSLVDMEKTGGTGRFWTFTVSEWIITESQHDAHWEFIANSPFNP
ncbi:MAG: pyridoxamine 5'-phosphate oxidase family protein [Arenibacter algicola]